VVIEPNCREYAKATRQRAALKKEIEKWDKIIAEIEEEMEERERRMEESRRKIARFEADIANAKGAEGGDCQESEL
jgi:peptidoglycan hydrolase CwlO-like protein